MVANISTLFTHNSMVSNTNTNQARNTAMQSFFTSLIEGSISGWTYISSSIPTPTTTLLAYEAIFDTGQGFRVKFHCFTSSGTKDYIFMSIYDIFGNTIAVVASGTATNGTLVNNISGTYNYIIDVKIESISLDNALYLIRLSGKYATTTTELAGKLYLTDKSNGSDDYVLFTDGLPGSFYTVNGLALKTVGPDTVSKDTLGRYGCTDLLLFDTTSFYKYAKVPNAIIISATTEVLTDGNYYSDGTDTYISFKGSATALIKL